MDDAPWIVWFTVRVNNCCGSAGAKVWDRMLTILPPQKSLELWLSACA
jgi:hypothetical protein